MHPAWLVAAAALGAYGIVRRRAHGRATLAAIGVATAAAVAVGVGLVPLPDIQKTIEDAGTTLGTWTYLLVGGLAFLETGAFIGLVAPGETAVIVGGVVAGQGRISLPVLIGLVWACAVAGDVTSFMLGRRLGRGFLLRHGARVKITEERLEQVEGFFERRGGTTIVVGRFIGFVRPIAPFVAGASRLPLARFLPYDVLGAGAWAATFCLLGYVFWRSFDRLTQWVSRGLAALGALVVLGVGVWFAARLIRDGALRAHTRQWLEQQLERPALRPFAPALRAGGRRIGRPLLHAAARPARWVWSRLTPGELGLELTTLLALTAVGAFTFVVLGGALDDHALLPFDQMSLDLSERLYTGMGEAVAAGVAALGSAPACAVVVLTTAAWAGARRRWRDAIVLVAAFAATWLLAGVAQSAFDRPAPPDPLVATADGVYPSAPAAQAVAWIACAVVLVRGGHRLATRFAAVTAATVLAVAVAIAQVALRACHLSDAVGGLALGTAVFGFAGVVALVVGFVRHNAAST